MPATLDHTVFSSPEKMFFLLITFLSIVLIFTTGTFFPSYVPRAFILMTRTREGFMQRRIWVRRSNASPTIVRIEEDSCVDEAREVILTKYANSLGRDLDAPDISLRIVARVEPGQRQRYERVLAPDEKICSVVEEFYPEGQTAQDALLVEIDAPQMQISLQMSPHLYNGSEIGNDSHLADTAASYFPRMPAMINQPPWPRNNPRADRPAQLSHTLSDSVVSMEPPQKSMPSPGGTKRPRDSRPKVQRQLTPSSASIARSSNYGVSTGVSHSSAPRNLNQTNGMVHSASTRQGAGHATQGDHDGSRRSSTRPSPLPTPPHTRDVASETADTVPSLALAHEHVNNVSTVPMKKQSSRIKHAKKDTKSQSDHTTAPVPKSQFGGIVPAINVLLVEDNLISLRVLQGMMKRLGVRWQTATNGQIAVDKWRSGGFHLVLMDIQMPVMNGLDATKEIRRLETANGIGIIFSSTVTSFERAMGANVDSNTSDPTDGVSSALQDDHIDLSKGSFKSPVIIVALTASALQSDRNEALTAGCNDFVTKPVDFPWLERKLKEWGSMQALIDFDGWREWKAQKD